MRALFLFFFAPAMLFNCQQSSLEMPIVVPEPHDSLPPNLTTERLDILALGDSYTKGESVPWANNFPNQMADSLRAEGYDVSGLRVIAQTGWRTDNLQAAYASQPAALRDSVFSLVTLCIGVNNQFQNANFDTYKIQFEQLLQTAIVRAGGRKWRVIVLSIPDWAYTNFGQNYAADPLLVSQKINQYNGANRSIANTYGVHYVNVTEISRQGLVQPGLVAYDGLHPSALQYQAWVQAMLPVLRHALKS